MTLICAILARRQVSLDQHFYRQREQQQINLLAGIRVVVPTPTKLAEIRSGDSEWSYLFEGDCKWGLIVDEHQRCFGS